LGEEVKHITMPLLCSAVVMLVGCNFNSSQTALKFNDKAIQHLDATDRLLNRLSERLKREMDAAAQEKRLIAGANLRVGDFRKQIDSEIKAYNKISVPQGASFQTFYRAGTRRNQILVGLADDLEAAFEQAQKDGQAGLPEQTVLEVWNEHATAYEKETVQLAVAQKEMASEQNFKLE